MLAALTGPALAQDAALVIGNRDYRDGDTVAGADAVFDALFALRAAGFQVISGRDANQDRAVALVDDFIAASDSADRVVVLLAGHMVQARGDTYFLPTDANARTTTRLMRSAVSLATLLDVAAAKPGGAIIALAQDPAAQYELGRNMALGLGDIAVPQGVTLVTGTPEDLALFVEQLAEDPGLSVAAAAEIAPRGVTVQGYVSRLHGFIGGAGGQGSPELLREEGWWDAARTLRSPDAVQGYLNVYPRGIYADEARALLDDLRDAPRREAEAAEQALGLDRDDRRAVQRMLSLLGYNTRGIDGIFGRGTRGALVDWQTANAFEPTGYLTRAAVRALSDQARDRNAELEAQAAEQAREDARREDALWRRVARLDTAEAYRSYLDSYPDGTFVENAQGRLRQLDRAARRNARVDEREFWDRVTVDGSETAYSQYLSAYPDGVFAEEATAQIAAFAQQQQDQAATQAAAAEEDQVIGNPIMRLLTERRLDGLGLEPGSVDGQFDDNTRRAIRQYQRARGLPVTGYVSQQTAVRMLAEAVR